MNAIVIGAGLSGAAVASALAQRGAQVTVLDAASAPAAGASSLPVGLMAPHVSKDDNLTSQLVRLGLAHTTREAHRLLVEGTDWQACGALYTPFKGGQPDQQPSVWFDSAAWIKPAALVRAWLAQTGVSFVGNAKVQRIALASFNAPGAANSTTAPLWQVFDATDQCIAQAPAVVVATATATAQWLPLQLHAVAGQVIYGAWTDAWQKTNPQREGAKTGKPSHHAVNGNGHFIPAVSGVSGNLPNQAFWLSGSTYEHDVATAAVTPQGMQANCNRLAQLLPSTAPLLSTALQDGSVQAWAGQRCTTRDRLPAAGAVNASIQPGLYVSTGMGSRGLSFAALCGEYVAQCIMGDAVTLSPMMQKALDPTRFKQ